jgi:tetratricopeptide (TPR) repeat protein
VIAIFLALISFAPLQRATNSRAATARGVAAFANKDYAGATNAFAQANALRSSPATAFNLGTAQVANGKREEGSATLAQAMNDRTLRADALYNRGNSALAAKAYDYAIRDYVETLKLRPDDISAKRNLEIALQKKQAMQQARDNNQKNQQSGQQGQKQPSPSAGNRKEQEKPQADANSEALLRAVQQQEQEELERMKRARAAHQRVGW